MSLSRHRRAWILPLAVTAGGLGLWAQGLRGPVIPVELLAQAVALTGWLLVLERGYSAMLRATLGPAASSRRLGSVRRVRDGIVLVAWIAALAPLTVVAEVWTQLAANRLLYHPGLADPTFVGWLRGAIDTEPYADQVDLMASSLSWFSSHVLGFGDEVHPFAIVMCAALLGDLLWALLAMRLGTGRLRGAAPLAARAFRCAALQAATAPVALLAYFFVRGGPGVGIWQGLFGVLLGALEAGSQVPTWIRVVGTMIFFLLPAGMVAWRLRADVRAAGMLAPVVRTVTARAPEPVGPRPRGTMVAAATLVVLLVTWGARLTAAPWGWLPQTTYLALWLVYLTWGHEAVLARTPAGRVLDTVLTPSSVSQRAIATLAMVLAAWPLAVAGLVVQLGLQWLVAAALLGPFEAHLQTYGWFMGQVRPGQAGAVLPPLAIAAAIVGNVLWAEALLEASRRAWQVGRDRAGRVLRLGAMQAATVPVATCAYLVLSIVTRDRAEPGLPRFDAWYTWSHVARAALGASLGGESVPLWLVVLAVGGLVALPLAMARRAGALEAAVGARRIAASPGIEVVPQPRRRRTANQRTLPARRRLA